MLEAGLIEEIDTLKAQLAESSSKGLPQISSEFTTGVLQSIGYKEFSECVDRDLPPALP